MNSTRSPFLHGSVGMATISKRRRNEASILTSFSISKRIRPAYSRTCKDRSEFCLFHKFERLKQSELCLFHKLDRSKRMEVCLFHKFERTKQSELCLFHKLDRSKQSKVCLFHKFKRTKRSEVCLFHKFEHRSGANSAYSRNRQDRNEKNKLDRSKTNRGNIFKTFMEPRN